MKKFCIILMILTIIIIGSAAFIKNNETHTEYLRIHIRADSNEAEAQAVKYEVKGEVVKMLTPYLAECRTKAQAEQTLKNLLGEIEKTADAVLAANGFSYRSKASVREEEFPTPRLRRPHPRRGLLRRADPRTRFGERRQLVVRCVPSLVFHGRGVRIRLQKQDSRNHREFQKEKLTEER